MMRHEREASPARFKRFPGLLTLRSLGVAATRLDGNRRLANRPLPVPSLLDIRFRRLIPILRPRVAPAQTAHVVSIGAALPAAIFNRERWVYRTLTETQPVDYLIPGFRRALNGRIAKEMGLHDLAGSDLGEGMEEAIRRAKFWQTGSQREHGSAELLKRVVTLSPGVGGPSSIKSLI